MGKIKKTIEKKRNFFSYTEDNMQKAIQAVREHGLTKKAAALEFGVPRSTLIRKLSGTVPLCRKMGPPSELTEKEENILVTWILAIAKKGFPVHKTNLVLSVKKYLQENGRETRYLNGSKTPGRSWFESFLKRHPEIKQKHAEAVGKARAAVTQDRIHQWFDEILDYCTESNLLDALADPTRIFNADESGFMLCPKTGKVLGPTKSTEDFYQRVSSEKEQITVMAMFSADGKVVPPMLIFPYKKMPKAIVVSVPENWALGRSDSGWINSEVFYEYIANHFIPYLKSSNITRPILLFVDGHRSHLTQQVSQLCDDHGVTLISLFPNATHIMQPADVAVFKPLKAGWTKAVRTWKFENFPKEVTRYTFGSILKPVLDEYATSQTIQNGFRKSGLFPFDKNNVDYSKCIPNRKLADTIGPQSQENQTGIIEALEQKIERETLQQFMETYESGHDWEGDIKATDLYKVWLALKNDFANLPEREKERNMYVHQHERIPLAEKDENVLETPSTSNNQQNVNESLSEREKERKVHQHERTALAEKDENVLEAPSTSNNQSLSTISQSGANMEWKTPDKAGKLNYQKREEMGYKVPTPFKKCLIFPNSVDGVTPKRKKTIFPAVVSSGKYREFYMKEANKKMLPKKKKNKALSPTKESSDSDISVAYEEDEDENELDLEENEDLILEDGKYVIVSYEENYYPGVILKKDLLGAEVSSMMNAGLGAWKWPAKPDILYYFKEDVVCSIKPPKLKNSRGHYSVPEMEKY